MKLGSGCWIFLTITVCAPYVFSTSLADLEQSQGLLTRTLHALKRSLEFFNREHKNVNLDAIIGTRMVDAMATLPSDHGICFGNTSLRQRSRGPFYQRSYDNVGRVLKVLLHHIDYDLETWPLDGSTLQNIRDLQALAEAVSDKALPYVQASDPPYYQRIGQLIQKDFWTLDFPSKDFTADDIYNAWLPHEGESIHEDESDNCLTELFGTGPNSNAKCHISTQCWDLMTRPGYSGYSLTHQVFYLQIAYQMGCSEEMNRQRMLVDQPPPGEQVGRLCAAVYLEAKDIAKKQFPPLRQDLFMEQAVLCGLMGYRWFFSPEWLMTILSWQDRKTGCFKGKALLETQVEFRPRPEHPIPSNAGDVSTSRVKREERILDDGCLCHRTTVAAGALVNYVRYIAEFEQLAFVKNQIFS